MAGRGGLGRVASEGAIKQLVVWVHIKLVVWVHIKLVVWVHISLVVWVHISAISARRSEQHPSINLRVEGHARSTAEGKGGGRLGEDPQVSR